MQGISRAESVLERILAIPEDEVSATLDVGPGRFRRPAR